MKRLTQNCCLLAVGIMAGWWLHGSVEGHLKEKRPIAAADRQSTALPATLVPGYPATSKAGSSSPRSPIEPPNVDRLRQLLNEQKFRQAVAYYEQALLLDESNQHHLKPVIEEAGGRFVDFKGTATASSGEAVATNGKLLGEVLAIIAGD